MDSAPVSTPLVLLLGTASRVSEQAFLRRFAEAGYPELRRRHASLFQSLAHGGKRAKDIATLTGTTPQAVAQMIGDLEASGDVERTPDPADGRARLVVLTERGRGALAVCDEILADMERELAAAVGVEGVHETTRVLEGIAAHFGARR